MDRALGFTLVEMMIVVVIIAVLAAVAFVAFTRHLKSGRLVAAREFISQIQARQETYFQQHGFYTSAGGAVLPTATFYPPLAAPEPDSKDWAPTAGWGWHALGARPEAGHTHFAFYVEAGTAAPSATATALGVPTVGATDGGVAAPPWYYVIAHGDLDGDASGYTDGRCSSDLVNPTDCTVLWATNARSEIVMRNDPE